LTDSGEDVLRLKTGEKRENIQTTAWDLRKNSIIGIDNQKAAVIK
jgi:hypothetical protein